MDGDVALVLSSLVDYRRETAWARAMRRRGVRVGFIGLASARLPRLFEADADFIIDGEPEAAVLKMVHGDTLSGIVESPAVRDLDALPFPGWIGCSSRGVASRCRLPGGRSGDRCRSNT